MTSSLSAPRANASRRIVRAAEPELVSHVCLAPTRLLRSALNRESASALRSEGLPIVRINVFHSIRVPAGGMA